VNDGTQSPNTEYAGTVRRLTLASDALLAAWEADGDNDTDHLWDEYHDALTAVVDHPAHDVVRYRRDARRLRGERS
jgi:hypothetical protein